MNILGIKIFLIKMDLSKLQINLNVLPPETITEILLGLNLTDLNNFCQTSQAAMEYCKSDQFWKTKYKHDFQHLPSEVNSPWKEMYKLALLAVPISPISSASDSYAIIDDQSMLYIGGDIGGNIDSISNISPFQQKVRSVSQASSYIGAITDDGKVHFWGDKLKTIFGVRTVQNPTEFKIPGKAIKISCGPLIGLSSAMFAVILEDRSVFLRMYYEPMKPGPYFTKGVTFSGIINITGGDGLKRNIKALDISTNGYALAIVSTSGKLYYLGKNVESDSSVHPDIRKAVGIIYKDGEIVVNPVRIHLPFQRNGVLSESKISEELPELIKQVSLDLTHMGVLSRRGTIYLWGSGEYGQLGGGNKLNISLVDEPLKLTFPVPISFISIRSRTTAAIDKNGKLYIWGEHKMFTDWRKFANLDDTERNYFFRRPTEIKLQNNNTNIRSIFNYVSVGWHHIVTTTDDGYVNVWGSIGY
uniref:F-box and regulator of chromosome condensation repeat protein n=1 Tax=Pithovirus LCPAC202 TaxID=2506592 RepID=A0A481Z642_9VIRU|nr:MAG: F-box and regulator of chromosome condensation repeat protein [Pithovirus LCPAC202]